MHKYLIAIALQRSQPPNHLNSALYTKNNLVLNMNISVDSLCHSNTFAKTYCKFMKQIYKLTCMRGNLTLRAEVPSVFLERTLRNVSFLGKFTSSSHISTSHSDFLKLPTVLGWGARGRWTERTFVGKSAKCPKTLTRIEDWMLAIASHRF